MKRASFDRSALGKKRCQLFERKGHPAEVADLLISHRQKEWDIQPGNRCAGAIGGG